MQGGHRVADDGASRALHGTLLPRAKSYCQGKNKGKHKKHLGKPRKTYENLGKTKESVGKTKENKNNNTEKPRKT